MLNRRVESVYFGLIVCTFFLFLNHQALALDGSIAVQGGVAGGWDSNGEPLIAGFGFSGHVAADVNLSPAFALGLGQDVNVYVNNTKRLYSDGTDLLARFSPLSRTDWNPYLLVGAGFRPVYELIPDHRWWKGGDFHGTVGVGVRHPVLKGMDLDLTAFYEMNPASTVLNSLGARVGVSFPFSIGSENSKASKADSDVVSEEKTIKGKVVSYYTWQQGDSLRKVAAKIYGNPEYADGLMEANQDLFVSGYKPRPGDKIRTPSLEEMKDTMDHLHGLQERSAGKGSVYQVHQGDCLWLISLRNYGLGHEWDRIYKANHQITDPNLIYPSEKLEIPGMDQESVDQDK